MSELTAIVLAAGQGKRMKSALPKVLHPIAGRPLVYYPVAAAVDAGVGHIVVVASPATRDPIEDALTAVFGEERITMTVQDPPRGTGDAARVGLEPVSTPRVMILYGDTPLIESGDLGALVTAQADGVDLSLLTCLIDDPAGYGRVLRDADGRVTEVREHRDLDSDEQRAIREVNAGMYVVDTSALRQALGQVRPANAQGEYYLTDVVALAAQAGGARAVVGGAHNLAGVNDRAQLLAAERALYIRIAERHGRAGVSVRDGARIDDTVSIDADAVIQTGAVLRGWTRVAKEARIEVGCVVTDANIGAEAVLEPYSVVTACNVGQGAHVGPFAHVRPGTDVGDHEQVDSFAPARGKAERR